jgi:hypothetical protein
MPCCSCPLPAPACAGTRSTTKNPGARCALARSISRGYPPSVITALLPPSRPAPARQGDARSPNYRGRPGACLPQHHAAARTPSRERPGQRHRGNPTPAALGRGPSRAHTAPVRARPYPAPGIPPALGIRPGCGRPSPGLPGTAVSAACAAVSAEPCSLGLKRVHQRAISSYTPAGSDARVPWRSGRRFQAEIVSGLSVPVGAGCRATVKDRHPAAGGGRAGRFSSSSALNLPDGISPAGFTVRDGTGRDTQNPVAGTTPEV